MKKILSIALVLVLVLSLGATAFAADEVTYTDGQGASFTLKYTGSGKPEETFKFSDFTCTDVQNAGAGITTENAPKPTKIADVTVSATEESKTVNIALPTYTTVGVYTYTFNQTVGTTAGVTYYKAGTEQQMKLVVTVIQDETEGANPDKLRIAAVHVEAGSTDADKTGEIENTYEGHKLTVSKTVEGNFADRTKDWNFTVVLTAPEGTTVNNTIQQGETDIAGGWTTKTLTFTLKHGESIDISNIPVGTTYTVVETESGENGYTTEGEVTTATALSEDTEVDVKNTKNTTPDTGISLDSLPYILIVAVVLSAAVVMFINKRRSEV